LENIKQFALLGFQNIEVPEEGLENHNQEYDLLIWVFNRVDGSTQLFQIRHYVIC